MLTDQAEALRDLAAVAGLKRAQVVAVTSGKGGVGKSHIAVNLAVRLSQLGRKVLLVDADLGTANADVLCNIMAVDNLAHVVAGRRSLEQAVVEAPGGFHMIPGASGLAQMAALSEYERERIIRQLRQMEQGYDIILLDPGAGVSRNVLSFAVAADLLLAVTTPEPTAVTDVYAVIKVAWRQRADIDVALMINMVKSAQEAREVFERVNAVCRRFLDLSLRDAGYLLRDPVVQLAAKRRRPFVLENPDSLASGCINRLAHRLDRHAAEPQEMGLLDRVAAWLSG